MKFVAHLDPDLSLLGETGPAALALAATLAAEASLSVAVVPAGRLSLEFGPFLETTSGYRMAVAGSPINGHRAVEFDADGALRHTTGLPWALAGVVLDAAVVGAPVRVFREGSVSYEGWSWVDGPVFALDEGVLSQTAPASGILQIVGRGIGQRLHLNIQPPIGVL